MIKYEPEERLRDLLLMNEAIAKDPDMAEVMGPFLAEVNGYRDRMAVLETQLKLNNEAIAKLIAIIAALQKKHGEPFSLELDDL